MDTQILKGTKTKQKSRSVNLTFVVTIFRHCSGSENDLTEDKSLDYGLEVDERQAPYMPIEMDQNSAEINSDDDIENDCLNTNDDNNSFDDQLQCMAQDKMSGVFFEHAEAQFQSQIQAQEYVRLLPANYDD